MSDIGTTATETRDALAVIEAIVGQHPVVCRCGQSRRDRPLRFQEIAETGLIGLHEGNYARYWVTYGEFAAWHTVGKRSTRPS